MNLPTNKIDSGKLTNFAILIPYHNRLTDTAFTILSLLFPVWAIIFPIWFCLLLLLIFKIPGALDPLTASILLVTCLIVPVISLIITALCEDNQIIISKDGIAFPLLFAPALRFRREFAWKDLAAIHLRWQGDTSFLAKDFLDLVFSNSGYARIPLKNLAKPDLEELILGLSLWAGDRGDEQHLKLLQTSLRDEATGQKCLSIFDLWEQELIDRFGEISFEPLAIDTFLQGKRIRIIKQLGFGGFSAIYLAQLNQRDLVVLKEAVNHTNKNNQSTALLLKEEASLLAQINHPQIVKLIDHFVENERQYLVIQYITGQSIRQLVRENGPQSEAQVINWAISICNILHHLHSQNPPIIHLDITPENLLVCRNGEINLIDFGSAQYYTGNKTNKVSGKQNYMPPEQINFNPAPQSDVFALACTMYYMLTGQEPSVDVIKSLHSQNSRISIEFNELLTQCITSNLSLRLQSVQILKERLLNILETKNNIKE